MIRRLSTPLVIALVLTVLGALAAPVGLVAPAEVRGAATDLTLVSNATYTVRPDDGRVGVSVAVRARNRTSETRTRRFWFDHAFLAVQPGAASPRIAGGGARVRVVNRTSKATMLRIDFANRLFSGKSTSFRLLFDLPGTGRKAAPQVRVGDSLVTVPVWAFASNGVRGSTVAVRFPKGWDVAVESGELPRRGSDGGGGTVLSSGAIDAPLRFFAYVTAQRPPTYVDREVAIPVGDATVPVVLQGWQDDPGWATRVQRRLKAALPVLAEDIGVPWPLQEPLIVREAANRDANAVAGRFDPGTNTLELAYWAAPAVIVRQLSHAWFNGSLLSDRWTNEGFASWYALRAAETLEIPMAAPSAPDEQLAAVGPLADWTGGDMLPPTAGAPDPDVAATAAAHALAAQVAERVGPEALRAAWVDVAAGTGAYQPPAGTPAADGVEGVTGPPDWRGLLDVLEARSGEDLDDLWRASVVAEDGVEALDARADAQTAYERTLAIAGDWQLPRAVRDAMRAWQFESADALMADARTVFSQRNALAALAERDDLRLPGDVQPLFEDGLIAEASARAEAERNAILAIADARSVRSSDDDILSQIGRLGEDPDADLAAARTSLAAGDLPATLAAADRAHRAWTAAWQEGRRRALLAIAVLATVLVLASAVVAQVRRSRRSGAGSAVGAAPSSPRRAATAAGASSGSTAGGDGSAST